MQPTENNTNRRNKKQSQYLLTYAICFVSLGLCMPLLGVLLPYLAGKIGVSLGQISFLFTTGSLGYMAGSAGGGRLFDKFDGHGLMIIGLLIMVLVGILIPLVPWFYLLLFVVFLFGIGRGVVDIGGNVNLLWIFHSDAGPYMNALHFSFGVGAFLSPILIHQVMIRTDGLLIWPFWVISVLCLPGIIGLKILKSPKNHEPIVSLEQKTTTIDFKLITLLIILCFLYASIEVGFSGWIFTYSTELEIVSETAGSFMTSVFWGALTLGRLLSIPIAKRIKTSHLLIGNFILGILFLGLILIYPLNPAILWIGSTGLGFALSSVFPTLMTLAETRQKMSGGVTGLFFLGASSGGIVTPMLLGQIFEYIGSYQMIMTLFAILCTGFLVLIFVLIASNRVGEKMSR